MNNLTYFLNEGDGRDILCNSGVTMKLVEPLTVVQTGFIQRKKKMI